MPSVDENFTWRLLAEDTFHKLLLKLKRIFRYQIKNKDLLNEFREICKELNKINENRNNFVHAIFSIIGEEDIERLKLKPDIHIAPLIFERKQLKLEDIENFIDRIIKAKETLSNLNNKIIKLLPK